MNFHWKSCEEEMLISILPVLGGEEYDWSGAFDANFLGTISVRVRKKHSIISINSSSSNIKTIRVHTEIKPDTGGLGVIVSLREEEGLGRNSLYRIENHTHWPVWVGQFKEGKGGKAQKHGGDFNRAMRSDSVGSEGEVNSDQYQVKGNYDSDDSEVSGDFLAPSSTSSFGWDSPNGAVCGGVKNNHKEKKNSNSNNDHDKSYMRLVLALAPFDGQSGRATTKELVFRIGEHTRLAPHRLGGELLGKATRELSEVRVFAFVKSDGPSKVIVLQVIKKKMSVGGEFGAAYRGVLHASQRRGIMEDAQTTNTPLKAAAAAIAAAAKTPAGKFVSTITTNITTGKKRHTLTKRQQRQELIACAADNTVEVIRAGEDNLKDEEFYLKNISSSCSFTNEHSNNTTTNNNPHVNISIRVLIRGIVISIVDNSPSELCTILIRDVNGLCTFDTLRRREGVFAFAVGYIQVDNHLPGSPYSVALHPEVSNSNSNSNDKFLQLSIRVNPEHSSRVLCVKSVHLRSGDVRVNLDVAFIVRMHQWALSVSRHAGGGGGDGDDGENNLPNALKAAVKSWTETNIGGSSSNSGSSSSSNNNRDEEEPSLLGLGVYCEDLIVEKFEILLSISQGRALTEAEEKVEGKKAAALHAAVRKGDVKLGGAEGLAVAIGHHNKTASSLLSGIYKSFVFDTLLQVDKATLKIDGFCLQHFYSSRARKFLVIMQPHYQMSLQKNIFGLLGSMSAIGNPFGLVNRIGDGAINFIVSPYEGLKKSMVELDPSYVAQGVVKGTGALGSAVVGGLAQSAGLLTSTLSKNLAILTLDTKYKLSRDVGNVEKPATVVGGLGSGGRKLLDGVLEGVDGAIRKPMEGVEKGGILGLSKGLLRGGLGLVLKPVIGMADAATDVLMGVDADLGDREGGEEKNGGIESGSGGGEIVNMLRVRRALYGKYKIMKDYKLTDAVGAKLLLSTNLGGSPFCGHVDIGNVIVLLTDECVLVIDSLGEEKWRESLGRIEGVVVEEIVSSIQVSNELEEGVEIEWKEGVRFLVKFMLRGEVECGYSIDAGSNEVAARELKSMFT